MYNNYIYEASEGGLSWQCQLKLIGKQSSLFEAVLEGNGSSFHVIAGPQIHGMFLCIPDWQVGCELSTLEDTFWNSEQLRSHLSAIDTRTIVTGLAILSKISEDKIG